ncbi:uncharacterized protein LOC141598293 [Silene latifolia]|uniref:uncharacterized protein LOC141598293 n=1 Tax=Silene latifolia TaxID=37657 RepID=UPI003D772B09
MATPITSASTSSASLTIVSWLRSFMDRCKLEKNGSNFADWDAQHRLAAQGDDKLRYLTKAAPTEITTRSTPAARQTYEVYQKESAEMKNVLIFAMEAELQRSAIKISTAHEIYMKLVNMFSQAPRVIQYEAASAFFDLNIKEGQKVSPHVLKLMEHVETLKMHKVEIPNELVIDRILHSLSKIKAYVQFRVNFNMQDKKVSLDELHKMLVQAEWDMGLSVSTTKDVLNVNHKSKGIFKKNGKKGKKRTPNRNIAKTSEASSSKPKYSAPSGDKCHYCCGVGHWKRNCSKYLGDIKAGKVILVGPPPSKDKGKEKQV